MTKEESPVAQLSPASQAVLDYARHGCPGTFQKHLVEHLANGYVISTPDVFLMAKAVVLEDGRIAWYVTYARGPIQALVAQVPFPLPFIALRRYRRGKEILRVYPFDRFICHSSFVIRHFCSHV